MHAFTGCFDRSGAAISVSGEQYASSSVCLAARTCRKHMDTRTDKRTDKQTDRQANRLFACWNLTTLFMTFYRKK